MTEIHFTNLLIVVVVAFAAPLILGLTPRLRVPAVVLEIVAGIAIGPSGFGWVEIDAPVQVLAVIGLAFLLFVAGLEIDLRELRGKTVRLALLGFAMSVAIAFALGLGLHAGDFVKSPLLVAIILSATSLGVIVPVLKDANQTESAFGQLVIAAGSIADFGAIILLTLFFSGSGQSDTTSKLVLLAAFAAMVGVLAFALKGAERSMRLSDVLVRLQDTTAQIRVRGAFVLMIGFTALAEQFGLETILGAFAAGAVLTAIDRDETHSHPQFRLKLEAVAYGVFIPVFFVTTGLRFDLGALFSSASTLARVPLFLAALLLARGLPALLYRGVIDGRRVVAAALMQATSLPFIVAGTTIGLEMGLISQASSAAFIAAGLLTVIIFPTAASALLRDRSDAAEAGAQKLSPQTATTGGM
ncbi:MAG: cation:proton antiporter [Solirubrobacterales bacterium]